MVEVKYILAKEQYIREHLLIVKPFSVLLMLSGLSLSAIADVSLLNSIDSNARNSLQSALNGQQSGVAAMLEGFSTTDLSRSQAIAMAVKQAPQLSANEQARLIAEANLVSQKALFDWTLTATASLTQTDFNQRTESINRERVTGFTISGDEPAAGDPNADPTVDEDGTPVVVSDIVGNLLCITIAGEIANPEQCAFSTEISEREEFASADADATNAWSFGLSGARNFHMGSQLELGLSLSRRTKNFYPLDDLGLLAPLSVEDPIGNGSRYPWTTTLFVQYVTPLPFGKNFGQYGSAAALGEELAVLADQQSLQTEHNVREQLLQQVDSAWWQLSRSVMRLETAKNKSANLTERLDAARRRYEQREITNFEYTQVRAALARSKAGEQAAWVTYRQSSQQLSGLLGLESATALFPVGLNESVKSAQRIDQQEFLDSVVKENPALQADRVAVLNRQALVKNAEQNFKPDLNVVVRMELSQSDRVLGYESAGDSLSNSLSPDNANWFVGLNYRYPFGKNAEKARRYQTQIQLSQAKTTLLQNEIALTSRANQTVVSMDALIANTETAAVRVGLAKDAFERATRERARSRISEFEYLQIVDDFESAQVAWIDQLISQQTLRSSALALQGKLMNEAGADL